ncbi:hypothetical protein MMC15_006974 [Xylographa vitiligo]|nr:hypothetical protein [Xylographa vitiligo]
MDPIGIAGLAISAIGLAIQLCETGDKVLDLAKVVSSDRRSDARITQLPLLTSHECEQSKLLKSILFHRGRFGFPGSLFEGMDERNQNLVFAILYQLSETWLEFQMGLDTFSGRALSRDGPIAEQRRKEGDLDRLEAILSTATIWNERIERSVKTHLWLSSMDKDSPEVSIGRLEQVAQDSSVQRLGWAETEKLRQVVIAIGTSPTNTTTLVVPPSLRHHDNSVNPSRRLSDGVLSGLLGRSNVLVEFRAYTKSNADIPLDRFERRIEQLTALLHIS